MAKKNKTAIGALDSYTEALTTMRGVNQAFGKDLNGLSQKLRALDRNKVTLRIDTDNASAALEKARNQFDLTGKAADKAALRVATQKYDTVKRNLDLVSTSAGQVEKNMASMTGAIEKADNRTLKGNMGKLAQSGLGQMAADTVSNAIGTFSTSAFGSKTGSMIGGAVSGAASGALMGSVVPGIGTAIGAVVGGISGIVNAKVEDYKSQDEAFKATVQESYNSVTQEKENSLSNGTSVAAAREQDRLRFSTLLGGDDEADTFLSQITDFASNNPYDYSQLTALSGALLNYGYKQDEIEPLLTKVGDAGSALGLSADTRNGLVESIAAMRSAGAVSQNDLAPFLRQNIDVWKYLADSSDKTEAEVREMVSKGQFSGKDAAESIANGLGTEYSGGMQKQSQTYAGLQENLKEAQDSIDASMGEGYTEERKAGVQNKLSALKGDTGAALKEAYAMQGKFQASLENQKDELEQNALAGVVSGTIEGDFSEESKNRLQELAANYQKSIKDAKNGDAKAELQAERDIEEAKIIAANEYKETDGYKLQLASDLALAGKIRDDTQMHKEYWETGYVWGQILSQGLAEGEQADVNAAVNPTVASTKAYNMAIKKSNSADMELNTQNRPIKWKSLTRGRRVFERATGLNRVPYNNFPALLHEGETVLTGVEARSGAASSGVTVTGNTFNVRKESDIDAIASQLFYQMKRATFVTP